MANQNFLWVLTCHRTSPSPYHRYHHDHDHHQWHHLALSPFPHHITSCQALTWSPLPSITIHQFLYYYHHNNEKQTRWQWETGKDVLTKMETKRSQKIMETMLHVKPSTVSHSITITITSSISIISISINVSITTTSVSPSTAPFPHKPITPSSTLWCSLLAVSGLWTSVSNTAEKGFCSRLYSWENHVNISLAENSVEISDKIHWQVLLSLLCSPSLCTHSSPMTTAQLAFQYPNGQIVIKETRWWLWWVLVL